MNWGYFSDSLSCTCVVMNCVLLVATWGVYWVSTNSVWCQVIQDVCWWYCECVCSCIRVCMCACIRTCVCVHMYACVYCMCARLCVCIHVCVHPCMCVYVCVWEQVCHRVRHAVSLICPNRSATVDSVSADRCGASPAWPSGLPADRTRDDRRSGWGVWLPAPCADHSSVPWTYCKSDPTVYSHNVFYFTIQQCIELTEYCIVEMGRLWDYWCISIVENCVRGKMRTLCYYVKFSYKSCVCCIRVFRTK